MIDHPAYPTLRALTGGPRSYDMWLTFAPGLTYSHVRHMHDEGLISRRPTGGRYVYAITEAGRAVLAALDAGRAVA